MAGHVVLVHSMEVRILQGQLKKTLDLIGGLLYLYMMKFIITESQENFLWLLRRLNEPSMIDHMSEIVGESFDYISACDFTDNYKGFVNEVLTGSVMTFINSYDDKFKGSEGIEGLEKYLYDFMYKKFKKRLLEHYSWELGECDE